LKLRICSYSQGGSTVSVIPVNFANPEFPGLSTRNPGIFGIETFPVYYYVTKMEGERERTDNVQ